MWLYFRRDGPGGGGPPEGPCDGPWVPPGPEFYLLLVLMVPCCGCPLMWLLTFWAHR